MRRHYQRALVAGAILATLILVGCGATSTPSAPVGAIHPTSPTATATAQAIPIVQPAAVCQFGAPGINVSVVQLNDGMQVSIPTPALSYPSELLPATVPIGPYQIPIQVFNLGGYTPNPPVNPSLGDGSGYLLQVCNPTQSPLKLSTILVHANSFEPLGSGTVNVWNLCDPLYDASHGGLSGGGCGGAIVADEYLHAQFAQAGPDATTQAVLSTSATSPGSPLPLTIEPGKSLTITVGIGGLNQDGTYTLSFGISADGNSPAYLTPNGASFLIAQHARTWNGLNCQSVAAQIPHASQSTLYVCPPTS